MKSRSGVARITVLVCMGLSWVPAVADPPHRRGGITSKRAKDKVIYQSAGGEADYVPPVEGDAKSGLVREFDKDHCPPIYPPAGIDGDIVSVDSRTKQEVDMQIRAAGIALDRAERHAAEWGHASIASAVLVETRSESDQFAILANTPYETFANAARKGRQGGASRLIEETLKARLEGKFGSDTHQEREDRIEESRQLTRFNEEQYQLELSRRKLLKLQRTPVFPPPSDPDDADPPAGETAPDGEDAEETETATEAPPAAAASAAEEPAATATANYASADLLPDLGDTNVFVNSDFSTAQTTMQTKVPAQATDETPSLEQLALLADHLQPSEGDVMKTAASNVVMQNILRYLTKPVRVGSDHVPWFMVTQVSVSPGSRTFRDYAAETTLHPYYAKLEESTGRLNPQMDPHTVHPGIFAAFPLVEAQALDLRNSERYETQLSMAIAAKLLAEGKQTEAKFFLEKVTKIQQDIATRTMLPIVVPNSNGREVTYRFDPGLQALVDPGNRKKGSGMILQPNSVPALIVIMTDRKSLKCYSHLHFELHTRWIPKKKSNVWSATWDGIFRNYNPRSAMLPSDVMGAAASMDEAKRRLDWVTWKLGQTGVGAAYEVALEQGRMRFSALMSKIGSYNSNISLPVHFNVLPNGVGGLTLDSSQEQKIMVERVSGATTHSNLGSLTKVFIGGFPFVTHREFKCIENQALNAKAVAAAKEKDAEAKLKEAELKRQELEIATREAESKRREAELKRQELEATVEQAASKAAEAEAKKAEAAAKKEEAELKNLEVKNWQERLSPLEVPEGVDAPAMQMEAQALESEVQMLKSESQVLESKVQLLQSASESLKAESRSLETVFQALEADSMTLKTDARALETASQRLQIESQPLVQKAAELTGKLAAMGYFEPVDERNLVITLPANRTWTLPTATHAVTGEFADGGALDGAITFGTVTLSDPAAIHVAPVATVTIPPQVPSEGIMVTLAGLHLNRVKSAYWNSNLSPVGIIGQGSEKLVLHIKEAPPKGTKEILISDSLPPGSGLSVQDYSRSIVGSVPVAVQEVPKTPLAVTSSMLAFEAGGPVVKFEGSFPKGEVTVVIASEFLTRTVMKKVESDAKVLPVELERSFFSNVVGKEATAKFTITHPDGKAPVTGSFPLFDSRVAITGVLPFDVRASEINGELDASVKVFGSFPAKDPIEVYLGGIQVAAIEAKDVKSPLVIPLKLKADDKLHGNLNSLKAKPGKKKLMLAFGGGLYEWSGDVNLSAD